MEVLNVCEEVFKWLDFNVEVEKLEYESKLKMVQDMCSLMMIKFYGDQKGESIGGGFKVEEVD